MTLDYYWRLSVLNSSKTVVIMIAMPDVLDNTFSLFVMSSVKTGQKFQSLPQCFVKALVGIEDVNVILAKPYVNHFVTKYKFTYICLQRKHRIYHLRLPLLRFFYIITIILPVMLCYSPLNLVLLG